jgi:predicted transcriptional regulator
MKKQIQIGVGDDTSTAKGFIDAWKRAERDQKIEAEHRLYFENLETLLKTLTTGRWVLLKILRTNGPMSIRALANELERDYKNVHTDVRRLEHIGLIGKTKDKKMTTPLCLRNRAFTNSREAPQAGYLSHTYMRSGNGLFYQTGFMKMAARPNGITVVIEQTTRSQCPR